jgi:membrane protein
MIWKELAGLVRETVQAWSGRQTFLLGAALAFYAAFALAPTLVLAIAQAGLVFGDDAAQGRLTAVLRDALGPTVARAVGETLTYVHVTHPGWTVSFVGFGLILFAATVLFTQLQMALNAIWEVRPKPGRGLWVMVRSRFLAFLLVLGTGVLLLASLTTNAVLIAIHNLLPASYATPRLYLWDGLNWLSSLALMTLLLAMIFKLLPDAVIAWRDVVIGAFVTALLFALGNYLISLYLCHFASGDVYGAAGSVMVVMLWVYYSSQILLFGAEFTRHFADKYGQPIRPADHAMYRPT